MTDTTAPQNTAPATDPVTSASPQHQGVQDSPTNSVDVGLQQQLQQFLSTVQNQNTQEPQGTSEADSPQEPERPTGGLNDLRAEDIGDPQVRRVAQLLDQHYPSLDRERILGRALEYGDTSYIDVNYLRDQVGEQSDLLLSFFEDVVEATSAGYEQVVKSIYDEVGGEANWKGVAQSFTKNAPDSVRNIVKQLVDSRDPAQVEEGIKFILDFTQKLGFNPKAPQLLQGQRGVQGGGQALSADDYRKALRELGGRNADPRTYDSKVVELRKQRARGIELNL